MREFINIKTVFENNSERTIDKLSKLYNDSDLLRPIIYELIKEEFLIDNKLYNKRIFIKPNWVRHSIKSQDEICLRTHNNFIVALVSILLEYSPKSILIGDAPVQGCNWDKMMETSFLSAIECLSQKHEIPIFIKDFRRVTLDVTNNNITQERNPLSEYLIFDLGANSYLEPISENKNIFRVTSYNPDRLGESHRKGVHKYCITKELFESDIIISMPKLKTHQKTGITGALKNLVGLNGDKDYLPHHRIGGVENGGDCYPGKNLLRLSAEKLLDIANRNIGKPQYKVWKTLSSTFWRLSNPKPVHQLAAGWYGNDTCWRMVMDLNKIALYGKSDGTLSDTPQRVLYSLCDGIIGGQGNGPLNPDPLALGVVLFSNNSAITDICAATLMEFDIDKISLLRNAKDIIKDKQIHILLNEKDINLKELSSLSIQTQAAPGWLGYI